ncbi:hypothetical protein [Rhodococcus sp. ARC_M6]|uniref:hypothetical protein n=1 Tax=Rhodococcus sp. ARC_M6 TaxID=2928852 RepID=UPI001FB30A23|nr:hypothetical protein [Rhodococcus sp. ARC_M6]MCJ0905598.1 hypothetical protein [Rhodococcus sp. ARC_M6]
MRRIGASDVPQCHIAWATAIPASSAAGVMRKSVHYLSPTQFAERIGEQFDALSKFKVRHPM